MSLFRLGRGEVWRKAGQIEDLVPVSSGISLTIPPRTAFQFRNTGAGPWHILIVTIPPWPGPQEAVPAVSLWPAERSSNAEGAGAVELGGEI